MISVDEAKDLIVRNSKQLPSSRRGISSVLHCILSDDIISPIAYPPFDQSAMDGFAIIHSDIKKNIQPEIVGESAAGSPYEGVIKDGQAVRIFTGAMIPEGADTVIVQEKVVIEKGKLICRDDMIEKGANIRYIGSQIKKGDVVIKKRNIINPASVGLIASLGIAEVNVISSPRVKLVVTGSELIAPGNPLKEGHVYESNSFALQAALESVNIRSFEIITVGDDEQQIKEKLGAAIENSDIVLTTGGISVGKYDLSGKAFQELGVKNIFYKIAQKPGKPIFFGSSNNCLVFGLPGNPAASLSCFYEYVLPALRSMQGNSSIFMESKMLPLATSFSKKEGLALFLKGKMSDAGVEVLEGQESSNINAFSASNSLIYLPAHKGNVQAGELVEVHILP